MKLMNDDDLLPFVLGGFSFGVCGSECCLALGFDDVNACFIVGICAWVARTTTTRFLLLLGCSVVKL